MMVAVAASCSYLTPLEPSCLMVYGPGKYQFSDFFKVGAPLTVLIYADRHRAGAVGVAAVGPSLLGHRLRSRLAERHLIHLAEDNASRWQHVALSM